MDTKKHGLLYYLWWAHRFWHGVRVYSWGLELEMLDAMLKGDDTHVKVMLCQAEKIHDFMRRTM